MNQICLLKDKSQNRLSEVIILVYQRNNGISRFDGIFVSMLEMGYWDGSESASNTLIHSLNRLRRQRLLFLHTAVFTG